MFATATDFHHSRFFGFFAVFATVLTVLLRWTITRRVGTSLFGFVGHDQASFVRHETLFNRWGSDGFMLGLHFDEVKQRARPAFDAYLMSESNRRATLVSEPRVLATGSKIQVAL